ncbi:peptidase S16 [Pigmentiphaga aceris]|uniref:Peptidase S16 n=1 Tax=Pigmentiphaga aceris TaxID=1940612 RepID=A0A5C0AXF7_9BURK|nr:LON peptidase substrate-binding domain-containing protein [Pigmentiphaga aceris]QEI07119.1 peptidase S16 [Pigmentiphaga aceris]
MPNTPLFPLNKALFPAGVLHLRIFEVRYLDMIRTCLAERRSFGVVALLRGNEVRTPEGQEVFAGIGTMARIDYSDATAPGLIRLRCVGTTRFRVRASWQGRFGLWMGDLDPIGNDPVNDIPPPLQASADALGQFIAELQRQGVAPSAMPVLPPFRLDEAGWVADRWCELLPLAAEDATRLLAVADPVTRLCEIQSLLAQHGLLALRP